MTTQEMQKIIENRLSKTKLLVSGKAIEVHMCACWKPFAHIIKDKEEKPVYVCWNDKCYRDALVKIRWAVYEVE